MNDKKQDATQAGVKPEATKLGVDAATLVTNGELSDDALDDVSGGRIKGVSTLDRSKFLNQYK